MIQDNPIKKLTAFLRSKGAINDLEKDILDTQGVLFEVPFDNDKARTQIEHNTTVHKDVSILVDLQPETIVKPANEVNELDRKYMLREQLKFLCLKEFENFSDSLYQRDYLF